MCAWCVCNLQACFITEMVSMPIKCCPILPSMVMRPSSGGRGARSAFHGLCTSKGHVQYHCKPMELLTPSAGFTLTVDPCQLALQCDPGQVDESPALKFLWSQHRILKQYMTMQSCPWKTIHMIMASIRLIFSMYSQGCACHCRSRSSLSIFP